jgi:hypothetical protein
MRTDLERRQDESLAIMLAGYTFAAWRSMASNVAAFIDGFEVEVPNLDDPRSDLSEFYANTRTARFRIKVEPVEPLDG